MQLSSTNTDSNTAIYNSPAHLKNVKKRTENVYYQQSSKNIAVVAVLFYVQILFNIHKFLDIVVHFILANNI